MSPTVAATPTGQAGEGAQESRYVLHFIHTQSDSCGRFGFVNVFDDQFLVRLIGTILTLIQNQVLNFPTKGNRTFLFERLELRQAGKVKESAARAAVWQYQRLLEQR